MVIRFLILVQLSNQGPKRQVDIVIIIGDAIREL